jgi:hypothetical protein
MLVGEREGDTGQQRFHLLLDTGPAKKTAAGGGYNNSSVAARYRFNSEGEDEEEDSSGDSGVSTPSREGSPVTFELGVTGQHHVTWSGTLLGKRMLVPLGSGGGNAAAASSKEAFVSLLEFAEEKLGCEHILVAIPKRAKEQAALVRTFMFMGFTVLSPGHALISGFDGVGQADHLFLDYEI